MDVRIKSIKKMTKIILLFLFVSSFTACDSQEEFSESKCGTHNGKTLYTGPQGGCYYYNSNGNKTYVDRSECNC